MKRFKTFLAEAGGNTDESTLFESHIVLAYNEEYLLDEKIKFSGTNFNTQKYATHLAENVIPLSKVDAVNEKFGDAGSAEFKNYIKHKKGALECAKFVYGLDIPDVDMNHYGSGSGNLSTFWTKNGGSNATPKTDIFLNAKSGDISLKQLASGSQLMSAAAGEAEATFAAAAKHDAENSGVVDSKLVQNILKALKERIVFGSDIEKEIKKQDGKNRYFGSGDTQDGFRALAIANNVLFWPNPSKKNIEGFAKFADITGKSNIFSKVNFKFLDKKGKLIKRVKPLLMGGAFPDEIVNIINQQDLLKTGKNIAKRGVWNGKNNTFVGKVIEVNTTEKKFEKLKAAVKKGSKKGSKWTTIQSTGSNIQFDKLLSKNDLKLVSKEANDLIGGTAAAIVRLQSQNIDLTKELNEWINGNPVFKEWFVFEAATGQAKFSNELARANWMVEWDFSGNTEAYKIKTDSGQPTKVIKKAAKDVKFDVNFKTGGSTSQYAKSAVRGSNFKPEGKEFHITNMTFNEYVEQHIDEYLYSKQYLDEMFNIKQLIKKGKDYVKSAVESMKNTVINIINNIIDGLKTILEKISNGLIGLMEFFGIELTSVKVGGGSIGGVSLA